ncbi:hypothetical protein [Mangrovactinospora gilvigrisea]|nr:hypothetical protein [Mangrovactinospora gilvigrisea]
MIKKVLKKAATKVADTIAPEYCHTHRTTKLIPLRDGGAYCPTCNGK